MLVLALEGFKLRMARGLLQVKRISIFITMSS